MHLGIPHKKGPVRCAESLEKLEIADLDHPPITRRINMPADKFEKASRARGIACYSITGLSALFSLICLCCGCRSLASRAPHDEETRKFLDEEVVSAAE